MNMKKDFYRFDPVRTRLGNVSKYENRFQDEKDFKVNPVLLEQIKFDDCQETTPEGKALWLYVRLCQLMKYDEGNFYAKQRQDFNDDPYKSFNFVENITADTPTTCFNFSRIAVKLLNEFAGVNALMIAVGCNQGHFRFGYYTDKVSVDAEPITAHQHYNDLARIKLGIKPQGLLTIEGGPLMEELKSRIVTPMLEKSEKGLQPYLDIVSSYDKERLGMPDFRIDYLVEELKKQGIDGSTTIQLLLDMNRKFLVQPYHLSRMAINVEHGMKVSPQLMVTERDKRLLIDLDKMKAIYISDENCLKMISHRKLLYTDAFHEKNSVKQNSSVLQLIP